MRICLKKSIIIFLVSVTYLLLSSTVEAKENSDVLRAKAICAACHGREGVSNHPLRPSLAGIDSAYQFKQLQDYQSGKRYDTAMQAQTKNLSEEQMRSIAEYFVHLPTVKGKSQINDADLINAKKRYEQPIPALDNQSCASCHGQYGEGNSQMLSPRIAGQPKRYLQMQLQAYQNASKENPNTAKNSSKYRSNDSDAVMRQASADINEDDIKLLSAYIEGLSKDDQ